MIRLEHIDKRFATGTAAEVHALRDLSINVQEGEFVVVLGSNGSGKSTLLNAIAGTIRLDGGGIYIDGHDVTRLPDHSRSRWVARIFQNPVMGTAPDLSILENFRLAALRTKTKKATVGTSAEFRTMVEEHVNTVGLGLEGKLDQAMGTLSGGQRQALALLMAVMDETKVLLLDEPTAALDPRTAHTVMELANRIIQKYRLTTLLVTHQMKDALQYGDRVLFLTEGKISKDVSGKARNELQINDLLRWFEV